MLENETWARCPVPPSFWVDDVIEFMQSVAPLPPSTPQQKVKTGSTILGTQFASIFARGNPFTKMIVFQNKKASSSLSPLKNSTGEDSDNDEPAELRADFIDEDAGDGPVTTRGRTQPTYPEDKGPLLATTTVSTVRLLAKYIHLLRVMYTTLGVEIFVAMVQIVEYFVYTLYTFFGGPPPGAGISQEDIVQSMSVTLRKMILRLRERLAPPAPVLLSAVVAVEAVATKSNTAVPTTPHDLVRIKWTLPRLTPVQTTELASVKTGYGMAMRTVGTESLLFLADALHKARGLVQQLVPPAINDFFAVFYTQVGLIPELRTHMYKAVTSAFIATDQIMKLVDNLKWDTQQVLITTTTPPKSIFVCRLVIFKDLYTLPLFLTKINKQVRIESGEYVDKLLKELVQFGQRLDRTVTLPPKVRAALWEAAILRGMETVVEAYAKAKRCTSEGRANMLQGILIKKREQIREIEREIEKERKSKTKKTQLPPPSKGTRMRGMGTVVEAYAKAKRCTSEGRTNMIQGIPTEGIKKEREKGRRKKREREKKKEPSLLISLLHPKDQRAAARHRAGAHPRQLSPGHLLRPQLR
jgi:hypothetical protein